MQQARAYVRVFGKRAIGPWRCTFGPWHHNDPSSLVVSLAKFRGVALETTTRHPALLGTSRAKKKLGDA